MKIKGIDLHARPYDERDFYVLGQKVTIKAQVVSNIADFEKTFPEPQPPKRLVRGSTVPQPHFGDPSYKTAMEDYAEARLVWMIVTSLSVTDDLEWDVINLEELETLTLDNLNKEFVDAGFPMATAGKVINLATSVNGLSEPMVEVARESFLPEAQESQEESSD